MIVEISPFGRNDRRGLPVSKDKIFFTLTMAQAEEILAVATVLCFSLIYNPQSEIQNQ